MNGHAALAALAPDLPVALADTPVEQRIGAATADAAIAIAIGLANYTEAGRLSPGVKQRGGAALGEVAELRLDYSGGDMEFSAIARREGRRVLELRHRTMLERHLSAAKVDAAFDDLIGHVLTITGKVVGVERALRTN